MTRDEDFSTLPKYLLSILQKVATAIQAVRFTGHGSVEIIIQDGNILDIVTKARERIN